MSSVQKGIKDEVQAVARKSDAKLLHSGKRLVTQFEKDKRLNQFRQLVDKKVDEIVLSAGQTIQKMHNAGVTTFNPFITGGFRPGENDFSNTLAQLFDPNVGHGFGSALFRALLDAVRQKVKGTILGLKIDTIICALDVLDPGQISVKRELFHPDGKPDIVVCGSGLARFIVLIENKAIGGTETITDKGLQTYRHSKILEYLGNKWQVEESSRIALFLTPTGQKATHSSFVELSSHELASSMIAALEAPQFEGRQRDLVRAFLMTYDWLNGSPP